MLKPLWDAYAVLKRGRDARQPLELDLPERKILLKPDGTVDRVIVPERLDAHKLIEEFMIQANVAAAETLEAKKQALVYRVHDAPSLAKQESLREFLATLDMSLARGAAMQPSQFNGILAQVAGRTTRAWSTRWCCARRARPIYSPENIGHFGLNLRRYAHFTSPIRRYADLIVHRALIAALGLGTDGITRPRKSRLEEIAELISTTERRAMAAERDTVDRLIAAYLAEQRRRDFRGAHLRRHQIRTICPIAAVRRGWFHTYIYAGRRLLPLRRGGARAVRRTIRQGLSACRPCRGAPGRSCAACRRDAF